MARSQVLHQHASLGEHRGCALRQLQCRGHRPAANHIRYHRGPKLIRLSLLSRGEGDIYWDGVTGAGSDAGFPSVAFFLHCRDHIRCFLAPIYFLCAPHLPLHHAFSSSRSRRWQIHQNFPPLLLPATSAPAATPGVCRRERRRHILPARRLLRHQTADTISRSSQEAHANSRRKTATAPNPPRRVGRAKATLRPVGPPVQPAAAVSQPQCALILPRPRLRGSASPSGILHSGCEAMSVVVPRQGNFQPNGLTARQPLRHGRKSKQRLTCRLVWRALPVGAQASVQKVLMGALPPRRRRAASILFLPTAANGSFFSSASSSGGSEGGGCLLSVLPRDVLIRILDLAGRQLLCATSSSMCPNAACVSSIYLRPPPSSCVLAQLSAQTCSFSAAIIGAETARRGRAPPFVSVCSLSISLCGVTPPPSAGWRGRFVQHPACTTCHQGNAAASLGVTNGVLCLLIRKDRRRFAT